jgi:hypothetical protein
MKDLSTLSLRLPPGLAYSAIGSEVVMIKEGQCTMSGKIY